MELPDGMNLVDDEYEDKMAAFEIDCNGGKGVAKACTCVCAYVYVCVYICMCVRMNVC